jgi:hypothetical protein
LTRSGFAAEHKVDRLDDEGFAGIGCAIEDIEAWPELDRSRLALWAKEYQMTQAKAGDSHVSAPKLRSTFWNSSTQ